MSEVVVPRRELLISFGLSVGTLALGTRAARAAGPASTPAGAATANAPVAPAAPGA